MEENDNDNIYIYTEEPDEIPELDDSGPNYSQADTSHEQNKPEKQPDDIRNPFLLLLKVMLNPVEGWKSVRRAKSTPETVERRCFLPLVAVLSASEFAGLFYSSRVGISQTLVEAVKSFVSFFFGYYCIMILLKMLMPKVLAKSLDSDFGKVFVLYSLSTLCLFYTATELLPMLWAILIFLPLWTVYIICRGTRFLQFPDNKQITCTAVLCLVVVGIPSFISWVLGVILPGVNQ